MLKKFTPSVIVLLILIGSILAACQGDLVESPEPSQVVLDTSTETVNEGPEINPPIIDGTINVREWESAVKEEFAEGSEIYLLVHGDDLFLGIRNMGGEMIAGNVFLEQDDRIIIMHSSAALGTAIYEVEGEDYRKIKDFEWCCRSKVDNEAARFAREMFYEDEGWLGQNSFIGNENELEYMIALDETQGRVAVNFILADGGGEKHVWPVGLEDGVAEPTPGGFPDTIKFNVEDWISLEVIQ